MSLFERLKVDCAADWAAYTDHEFVRLMGVGTLPEAAFRDYLVQDYLFLIQFARAYALAVYKGRSLVEMHAAHAGLKAILDAEMDLHVRMCAGWGLTAADLEQAPEKGQTVAYTRFVLDAGNAGDLLDLYVALAPCMIGYGEIGAKLTAETGPLTFEENRYAEWINEYSSIAYQEVAQAAVENLDRLAEEALTEARYPRLKKLFGAATRLEAEFWQMGLDAAVEPAEVSG